MTGLAEATNHRSPPIPRTRLIGRETEIGSACAALLAEAVPLLTLTGPGGVGKTRLALAVAAQAADRFADGVVWVDLAPLADPALVPATVARAVDVVASADTPLADALIRHLRPRQTLLLLDNCEHLAPAVADLASRLLAACPALQILATSRSPLHVRAEHEQPVDPLPLPPAAARTLDALAPNEAIHLFVERARAVNPTFALDESNAVTIAAICRQLDGLPLAIELAAAQMKILAPAALQTQMSDRLRLLRGGPRDAPARQQTIRDTIAWSYSLLTPEQQALFRRLSVFTGGFTAEAVRAMAEARAALDSETAFAALIDQSLVYRMASDGEPRFAMLETIREFGLEQLALAGDEDAARQRHAAYFQALASEAEPHLRGRFGEGIKWIGRLDAELANLRGAINWLLLRGDGMNALRTLIGIGDYIDIRGFLEVEARQWLEFALRLAPGAPPLVRAMAILSLSNRAGFVGDHDPALAAAREALAIAQAQDDPFILGRAFFFVGLAWGFQDDWSQAAAAHAQAVRHFRRTDRIDYLAQALSALGYSLHFAGEPQAAVERLDEARSLSETELRHADLFLGAIMRYDRALVACDQGEHVLAVHLLGEGIAAAQSIGHDRLVLSMVASLAGVAQATGHAERAARLLGAVAAAQMTTGVVGLWSTTRIERVEDPARTALGAEAFTAAWEIGSTMPWTDAVEDALAVLEPDTSPAARTVILRADNGIDLTWREREVLSLLCQRLTDAEIAAQLSISPRTVSTHVGHLLAKLGAPNRRQAVATAARLGLV